MDAMPSRFDELYDAEFATVYRYTTARLGRSDGEEVVADVFHAAAVAFSDGDGDRITGAWLMAVARNKVIDRWRRDQRRRARAHLVVVRERDAVETFPDHWSQAATRRAVLNTLGELSTRYRALLISHHVDGMSVPDIAASTGSSNRAVESALARARRAFRRAYASHEEQM